MHENSIAQLHAQIDHDDVVDEHHEDLVLERLPNGEMAWLRPEQPVSPIGDAGLLEQRRRAEWRAYRARARQYVFDVPTRYVLEAASEADARTWFTDNADLNLVDCGPMFFGKPRLVTVLPLGEAIDESFRPKLGQKALRQSALSRWCERLRIAIRFTMPKGWTAIDVPVVALEDLLP